jgi:hypothetical protein
MYLFIFWLEETGFREQVAAEKSGRVRQYTAVLSLLPERAEFRAQLFAEIQKGGLMQDVQLPNRNSKFLPLLIKRYPAKGALSNELTHLAPQSNVYIQENIVSLFF